MTTWFSVLQLPTGYKTHKLTWKVDNNNKHTVRHASEHILKNCNFTSFHQNTQFPILNVTQRLKQERSLAVKK